MAPQFAITGKLQAPSLKKRLERFLSRLAAEEGVGAAIDERTLGEYVCYLCTLDEPGEGERTGYLAERLRLAVAEAVAGAIVRDIGPAFARERVKKLVPLCDDEGAASILALSERLLARATGDEAVLEAARSVGAFLSEQVSLNVDGFLRFRLRAFRRRLETCAREAVRRFEAGREQEEFVKFLRYLVDHQESSVDELHIYPDSGNSFVMKDENGSSIDAAYLESYVRDLASGRGVDREDLLISAVVSLAPGKVHWHLDETAWRSPMLEAILDGRLVYCTGCDRCAPAMR